MWTPRLPDNGQPVYLAIVEALVEAIRVGELRPGDALPTHRLLADLLGVNVSTVTRAYREAARRRLVAGEVGRGTFVLGVASEAALFALRHRPEGGVIDLSTNMPPWSAQDGDPAAFLGGLAPGEAARLLHYASPGDALRHREAACAWLARRGVDTDPEGLMVCAGAHHAMDTAMGLFPEAEEVACEALVYPGLKASARHRRRRLHALAMDGEGVLPEALDAAFRSGLRLAILSPTLHNPTTATLGLARRTQLADIARRRDAWLVEEDVYGLLPEHPPPPLAALAPERVVYLTGLSKTVAPGLRLGYLAFPRALRARMRDGESHTSWYVSPLTMALATRWLEDGTAWRRLLAQRRELALRHRLCREYLQDFPWRGEVHCPHLWMTSPPGGSEAFARMALAAGVVVVPSEVFQAGRASGEDGLRLSIGAAADRASLAEGLARLAALHLRG
jgi:DNA-binding transcriptional MocR family regulator